MKTAFVGIALLLATASTGASATGNAAAGLEAMKELNVIVLGDMTGGHDVEGKTFVAGNLSNGATYGIGRSNQGFVASSRATLTVGGSVGGNVNINNGNNGPVANGVSPAGALIGGSVGNINLNANNATLVVGGSIGQTNGGNGATIQAGGSLGSNAHPNGTLVEGNLGAGFAATQVATIANQAATLDADVKALSTALGGLTVVDNPSSFDGSDHNNAKLIARDTTGLGYAVINIDASNLSSFLNAGNLVYDLQAVGSGYLTTIVNVSGAASITLNANSNNSIYNPYVLFNFIDATSITLNRQFNGSLLAPFATVTNSTPIEGSLVAANFHQGGEVHLGTFAGDPKLGETPPPVGGVPEPAIWAQLIAGFGLAGVALRRRRGTVVAA